jgi:RNA polymerase sigma-70 factor (ECF subfamily)
LDHTSAFLRANPAGHTLFLLDRARLGSESAWRELYRRYRTMLVVQIRSRIPDFARHRFDAEDVLQAAFFKAWAHIDRFEYRGEGSFRAWLGTLVFREFQNELRSQKSDPARLPATAQDEEDETELLAADSGQDEALRTFARVDLFEQLGRLDPEDRELVSMRVFEEQTWDEIGEILGCSRGHAQAQYQRAVERLQRLLE